MRIKINTNDNTADKLIAVSCQLSASRNLKPKTYNLKPSPRNLQPTTYHLPPSPRNLPPTTYNLQPSRGFTLVELLVTLSLFVVLTTIVLFSQSKFNGSILLTNLAYDVALTVRQAQTFGINVREVSSGGGDFQKAYGIHFDSADNKKFILFVDNVIVNGKYDKDSDSIVNTYSVKRGNYISKICVTSGSVYCSDTSALSKLDITFIRPNPDAIIKGDNYPNATEAKITISSADDSNKRTIVVNSTGQISIERN